MVPRENKNYAYTKFGGQTKSIMVFSEMAYSGSCSQMTPSWKLLIGKVSLTSPILIDVPSRASVAVETKDLLFLWLAYLNNKSNVCKQISSLLALFVRTKDTDSRNSKIGRFYTWDA